MNKEYQEINDDLDKVALDIFGRLNVDTIQIMATHYDPISGDTRNFYIGKGNYFSRKGHLREIMEIDFNPSYQKKEENE